MRYNNADEIITISNRYFETTPSELGSMFREPKASWKLVDWVVKYSLLTGNSKLVASTIASFYSKKNKTAIVSLDKIRAATGLSEGTINKSIKEMKLSGEWLIYTVDSKEKYSTFQRYVPLSPTSNFPGGILSLNSLTNELDKRNLVKGASKTKVKVTSVNFYKLWESYWTVDIMRNNRTFLLKRQKSSDTNIYEKEFLDLYFNALNDANSFTDEEKIYHQAFLYLRNNDFPGRYIVDSSQYFYNINFGKKERQKLALICYTNWTRKLLSSSAYSKLKEGYHFK